VVVAAGDPSDGSGMAPPGVTRRSRWRRQARGLRDERQGISFQAGEGGGGGGRRTRVGAGSRRWILNFLRFLFGIKVGCEFGPWKLGMESTIQFHGLPNGPAFGIRFNSA
jgi:hypothetical protein